MRVLSARVLAYSTARSNALLRHNAVLGKILDTVSFVSSEIYTKAGRKEKKHAYVKKDLCIRSCCLYAA